MRSLLLCGLVSLVLFGGGCEAGWRQWTSNTPVGVKPAEHPQAPGSTTSSTQPSVTWDTLPPIDWHQPYALALTSEDHRMHAMITVAEGRVSGRFQEGGQQEGEIYGTQTTSTGQLVFSLYVPMTSDAWAQATSTWAADGTLVAEMMRTSSTKQRLIRDPEQPNQARVSFAAWQDTWNKDASSGCSFSLILPTVHPGSGVTEASAQRMNEELKKAILPEGATTPQVASETYLRRCKADVTATMRAMQKTGTPSVPLSLQESQDTTVLLTMNQANRLSFLIDRFEYAGGAHGNTVRSAVVFETTTGKRLALRDLVEPTKIHIFLQRETQELLRLYPDLLFEDAVSSARAFVTDARPVTDKAQQEKEASSQSFFLTPFSLIWFYQLYDVTPYAVGLPEVPLPWALWQDIAR